MYVKILSELFCILCFDIGHTVANLGGSDWAVAGAPIYDLSSVVAVHVQVPAI